MADATEPRTISGKKRPHLITIRGHKAVEDALILIGKSLGLGKYETLKYLMEFYYKHSSTEEMVKEFQETLEQTRSDLGGLLEQADALDEVEVKRGRRPGSKTEAAVETA